MKNKGLAVFVVLFVLALFALAQSSFGPISVASLSIPSLSNGCLNITSGLVGSTGSACGSGGGGAGAQLPLDNCTPDSTGNLFYGVTTMSNAPWTYASWQVVPNTSVTLYCTILAATAYTSTQVQVSVASGDSTAGHTATIDVCYLVATSSLNLSPFTCATSQTYTTTASAYQIVPKTFNTGVSQAGNAIQAFEITVTPSGTQPTSNILIYPVFIP